MLYRWLETHEKAAVATAAIHALTEVETYGPMRAKATKRGADWLPLS